MAKPIAHRTYPASDHSTGAGGGQCTLTSQAATHDIPMVKSISSETSALSHFLEPAWMRERSAIRSGLRRYMMRPVTAGPVNRPATYTHARVHSYRPEISPSI